MSIDLRNYKLDVYKAIRILLKTDMNVIQDASTKLNTAVNHTAGLVRKNPIVAKYVLEQEDKKASTDPRIEQTINFFESVIGALLYPFKATLDGLVDIFNAMLNTSALMIKYVVVSAIKIVWAFVCAIVSGIFSLPLKLMNTIFDYIFIGTVKNPNDPQEVREHEALKNSPLFVKIKTAISGVITSMRHFVKNYFVISTKNFIMPTLALFVFSYVLINLVRIVINYSKKLKNPRTNNIGAIIENDAKYISEDTHRMVRMVSEVASNAYGDNMILELSIGDFLSKMGRMVLSPLATIKNNINELKQAAASNVGKFCIIFAFTGCAGITFAIYILYQGFLQNKK